MSEHDHTFMKNFSLILVGLAVFTLVIILVANSMSGLQTRPEDPGQAARVEENIAPVGQVYSGESGAAAREEALAQAAAATPAAFGGSMDGELIYNNVCMACHTAGVAGAPKLEQAAWAERMEQGMDTLVKHAIEGYQGSAGYMPPKGGRTDLSDDQVRASVQWMVDNLQP